MFFIENLKYETIYVQTLYILVLIFLYKSVIYDFKYKEISDKYTVPVLIFGLLTLNYITIILVAGILVIFRYITAFILQKESFGEADIIIYSGLAGFYNISSLIIIFFGANIIALIYAIFNKLCNKDENWKIIPFIPFILISIAFFNIYIKIY